MIKFIQSFMIIVLFLLLGACSNSMSGTDNNMEMGSDIKEKETPSKSQVKSTSVTQKIETNEFTLVAEERIHTLTEGVNINAWTFNGSVPGPEIRVQEREKVKINLKNELKDPVTIHWHGVPSSNSMDGIPGVTMNAVQPGKTFTYDFTATVPGTYWYHSHQDGVKQVDKGLYGSFIIEGKEQKDYDRDYVLVLDEWMSAPESMDMESGVMDSMDHEETDIESNDMEGMDHTGMNMESEGSNTESEEMGHDMSMYDIFTINGKSGKDTPTLPVKKGEKVRIRLVNAGFMSHKIHLHGHDFKVISTDGQEIIDPEILQDELISIAPGERYDIEFTADNPGQWYLECHGNMEGTEGMKAVIEYEDYEDKANDKPNAHDTLPTFNFTSYGENTVGEFTLDQAYDVSYTMNLNTETNGSKQLYTINDKIYPETESLKVKDGNLVKVKLVNNSLEDDHPMHLHGHFFQVLSKNGKSLSGSPIIKDTLNIKPGEEYIVAFKADNPGDWMFHCHDLHHATGGMVTKVIYEGFEPDFTPDPEANNKPE